MQLETCLKAGTEAIQWSNSERVTTAQLLDTFRRIVLKVLVAEHAYIIAPVDSDLNPTSSGSGSGGGGVLDQYWILEGERGEPTPVGKWYW